MKKYHIKNWLLTSLSISFVIILLAIPHSYKKIFSQGPFIFGGFVESSIPCTCSPGFFLLTISPPVGGQYLFRVGTQQYSNYRLPSAGVWTLGLYQPGGTCLMNAGKICVPSGAPKGIISPTVGTSL